ncbi:MAG: hypothetical protein JKY53_02420 [Flavobacteriales bacterium]|nr:hypothetical protein [Flavobacteriales bacterium]
MNSKYIFTVFSLSILAIIFSGFNGPEGVGIASTGAPVSSTGAPNETTCAKSGCHSDGTMNSGSAITTLIIGNDITEYQPGSTYDIVVKITDPNVVRFGYELTAITDVDSTFAGDFTVTDTDRTQIFNGSVDNLDREYLTYTYNGTEPSATGEGEWIAQWTAPLTDVGDVTFYLATVAANNDFTDDGDEVYTLEYRLTAGQVSAIGEKTQREEFNVFANNRTVYVTGSYDNLIETDTLYSIDGRIITQLEVNAENYALRLDNSISTGIYIIGVNTRTINPKLVKLFLN